MRIALHIGAHKTASTHIQTTLELNREWLDARGVNYLPRNLVRPFVNVLSSGANVPKFLDRRAALFEQMRGEKTRVIFSDENILKLRVPFFGKQIYPDFTEKLSVIRECFDGDSIDVFLSVRNFYSFFPSLYIEHIKHFGFTTFRDWIALVDLEASSWHDLLQRIGETLRPGDRFFVWTFENYVQCPTPILLKLTDQPNLDGFNTKVSPVRVGPSHKAVEAATDAVQFTGNREIKKLMQIATSAYPRSPKLRAYQPFDEREIDELSQMYKADIEKISISTQDQRWRFIY